MKYKYCNLSEISKNVEVKLLIDFLLENVSPHTFLSCCYMAIFIEKRSGYCSSNPSISPCKLNHVSHQPT